MKLEIDTEKDSRATLRGVFRMLQAILGEDGGNGNRYSNRPLEKQRSRNIFEDDSSSVSMYGDSGNSSSSEYSSSNPSSSSSGSSGGSSGLFSMFGPSSDSGSNPSSSSSSSLISDSEISEMDEDPDDEQPQIQVY